MAIEKAELVHPTWAARFNAGDLEGMLALAEDAAVFVPQPGVAVTGADAAAAQQGFMAIGVPIAMTVRRTIVAGDLALVIADWTLKGVGSDGKEVDLSGSTSDVLRRGEDGWKFAIDNPFGTA
jgi:ketosteroid isomerase-like protein